MVQIIFYLVLAVAASAAIYGLDKSRQNIGAAKQLAKDEPILNACKADRDTAVKANEGLQGDLVRLGAERDRQSAAVKDLSDAMQKQQADKLVRVAAAKPRIDALRADSAPLEQRLAANTEGKSCDEKLANVDRDLRAIVGGGVRELPPTPPATTKTPPKQKGVLRLSQ